MMKNNKIRKGTSGWILIFFMLLFLTLPTTIFANWYPDVYTDFSGDATYCKDAAAGNLSTTFTTCKNGSGLSTNLTINWYQVGVDQCFGGVLVQSTVSTTATTTYTYTPSTTVVGTSWYYVEVVWATGTCTGASPLSTCSFGTSTQAVVINPVPPATPGAISGNTTPSPLTGGLGYSIIAVPNATTYTWTVPGGAWSIDAGQGTTAMTATSGNGGDDGNITVTAGNSCGTSAAATMAVTVVGNPTITLGVNPTVCQGITSVNLTYSATTGSPNQYSVDYDATAEGQGFVDVVLDALPASPISLVISGAAVPGTYNANVTVRNSGSGLSSGNYAITVTVNPPTPATPGAISGATTVLASTGGIIYSIVAVPNATIYSWNVPAGWTIDVGNGTVSITVTSGTSGQDGNITVTAGNGCGMSAAASLGVICGGNPTITLGGDPSVCQGITVANLTYSATTESPDQYSIDYNAAAEAQGFVDVVLVALPASPIALVVPGGATPAIYSATLTVRNSGIGLASSGYAITVTVDDTTLPAPGIITGSASVSPSTGGLVYSIVAVPGASSYTWAVPTGAWVIDAGQGTISMTATSGLVGEDGNISVTEGNTCGISSASTFAVTVAGYPTITLGGNPTVCQGITSANLTYSTTGNNPDQYSIDYHAAAESEGFVDVVYAALPASPIVHLVPVTAATGTYSANLTVRNSTSGLTSSNYSVSVIISTIPATPGSITGNPTPPPTTSGIGYSIAAVSYATTYTWTVPGGAWSIDAGQGTFYMSATSGNNGDNGNITITAGNACGTSVASIYAVVVALSPTITLGANPIVCQGTTSTSLTYSATTQSPNQYSIDYDAVAEAQGFVDVTNSTLPASPISLVVPGAAPTFPYVIYVSVRNSVSGLYSSSELINLNVVTTPTIPGTISGIVTVNENSSGLSYIISPITYSTSYNWTVPTNWTIDAGTSTSSITVTSGNAGDNGNITVTAGNSCGISAASVKAVTCVTPTDHTNYNCNACHILHNSIGSALTLTVGNAAVCMSCHIPTGVAGSLPFDNADKAIPGISGTSHSWDVSAINGTYEAAVPADIQMADRVISGNIVCSTCHNQHNPNTNGSYLRVSNVGDALCKDCHSLRDVGRYADDNVNNRGSHPVGLVYNGADSRFNAAPTDPNILLVSSKIECSSCHGVHDPDGSIGITSDGYLLRATNNATLCTSCHNYGTHNAMNCLDCHQPHNTNKGNIYMIKSIITTPNSGNKPVIFAAETGVNSFADGDATRDGVCEVCHTSTNHYQNDGTSPDQSHTSQGGKNGTNCTPCHPHSDSFSPTGGGCHKCHETPDDYPTTGAHTTHAGPPYYFPCMTCHFGYGNDNEVGHPVGVTPADVGFDPNGMATRMGQDGNTPVWNSGPKTCDNVYCHSHGESAEGTAMGTNIYGSWEIAGIVPRTPPALPTYVTSPAWNTGTIVCGDCHYGTAAGNGTGATDRPTTGKHQGAGTHKTWCYWCHATDATHTNMGTYGSNKHVDGSVLFNPSPFSSGGTFDAASANFSNSHCGNTGGGGKTCWY